VEPAASRRISKDPCWIDVTSLNDGRAVLNHILSALSAEDRAVLWPTLEHVDLPARLKIEKPHQEIDDVYFIDTGIAAVVAMVSRTKLAVGLIGPEGASGIAVFLGNSRTAHLTVMLTAGTAYRMSSGALRSAMVGQPDVKRRLSRYCLAFFDQVANTAVSNASSSVEQRVARWILMASDRLEGPGVPVTHDVIAYALGIRRAGVTQALDFFRERELLHTRRGSILVVDRQGLEGLAGPYYGVPELEPRRLVDTLPSPN
jgi:CRP-like cAMP-binding protein